jgi:hypothetical protein
MKHIQNNRKSAGKSIPAYGFKNLKKKIYQPKLLRLLPNDCDFQKENHTMGYGSKSIENL